MSGRLQLSPYSQELISSEDHEISSQSETSSHRRQSQSPPPYYITSTTSPTANNSSSHSPAPRITTSNENGSSVKGSQRNPKALDANSTNERSISNQAPLYSSSSSTANPLATALSSVSGSITSSLPPASISISRQGSRVSSLARSCQPSPVSSVASGGGHSLHPSMLLAQNETTTTKAAETNNNNNMLTLGSYVQFMTLVSVNLTFICFYICLTLRSKRN